MEKQWSEIYDVVNEEYSLKIDSPEEDGGISEIYDTGLLKNRLSTSTMNSLRGLGNQYSEIYDMGNMEWPTP